MFKPLTRTAKISHRANGGFAETMFVHTTEDDDYSGFAPTELFSEDDEVLAPMSALPGLVVADRRVAASRSITALERASAAAGTAAAPSAEPPPPGAPAWVTSQWVAAQEAKAHEAADHARAVIAAQRRNEESAAPDAAASITPRTGLGRLRAAFGRLLPGEFRSLIPLFIGVTVTMALISAMLPMFDKP